MAAYSFPASATATPSSTAPLLEKEYELEEAAPGDEASSFLHRSSPSPPLAHHAHAHAQRASLISTSPPPGGWWNAVSRRFAHRNFTRRALVAVMLALVALVTVLSSLGAREGAGNDDASWYGGWKDALEQRFNTLGQPRYELGADPQEHRELDLLKVLNFDKPQDTLYSQLREGVRYATAMSYGGHANQMISIQKLLYFAKLTNRVPIIPSLIPVHIDGGPENISTFYDLPLFYRLTTLPALEMSQVKTSSFWAPDGTKRVQEEFPCWSIQESTVGFPNREAISFDMHGLYVHHWPLPGSGMARGAGGFDLSFDALRIWDSDVWAKDRWIERVRREFLPQQQRKDAEGHDLGELSLEDEEAREKNMKEGFAPRESPNPTDQIVAFDNSLFLGPIMFAPIDLSPASAPLEPSLAGEGTSWIEIGQHLHFTDLVESRATAYLVDLFAVSDPSEIPPFITVHLRRGDFAEFTGAYTDLEKYTSALSRLVPRLQARLDDPTSFSGPSRHAYRPPPRPRSRHGVVAAKDYAIVATTDEASDSPFVQKVRQLGWKVVDHERFATKETFGGWWPTLLDCAILARGRSFVGTDRSTYTHLAALRVKYWNGGVVEIA